MSNRGKALVFFRSIALCMMLIASGALIHASQVFAQQQTATQAAHDAINDTKITQLEKASVESQKQAEARELRIHSLEMDVSRAYGYGGGALLGLGLLQMATMWLQFKEQFIKPNEKRKQ